MPDKVKDYAEKTIRKKVVSKIPGERVSGKHDKIKVSVDGRRIATVKRAKRSSQTYEAQ